MRPSGVEWLGDLPEHWDVRAFQRVLRESLKYGANEAAELDDPDHPRFVRITDIDDGGRLRDETFRSLPPDVAKPYLLSSGDLLFARSGSVGRTFLYDDSWGPCAYAGYLIRARVDHSQSTPQFVSYFTASQPYAHWLRTVAIQATIENVSAERYSRMPIPLPSLDEQHAIAAFLDRETARIDALVAKKRLLIERLQEYRTALITRTVTRGLPPEAARAAGLDPSPRLKPSGVEWLGDVPEHWQVKRLEHLASYRTSSVDKKSRDGELPIRLCNYTDVYYQNRIRASDGEFMTATASPQEARRFTLEVGDILITKDSEDWQDIAIPALIDETAEDFVCGYHLGIIRPGPMAHSAFIFLAMQSIAVNRQLQTSASGVTRYGIPNAAVGDVQLAVPPLEEQRAVAGFLDREAERIDVLGRTTETAIERLQEHRTALITAAVTGKIDVRDSVSAPVAAA